MTSRSLSRTGAATGLAYVVLSVIGSDVIGPGGRGPNFPAPAPKVAAHLVAHPATTATYAGAYLELLGLLCFVVFAAGLYGVMRRAEGGDGPLSLTAFA